MKKTELEMGEQNWGKESAFKSCLYQRKRLRSGTCVELFQCDCFRALFSANQIHVVVKIAVLVNAR